MDFLCGGMIAIAGWALGIFEAIGLIIVVGLAVDYSVHICHSYNEARFIEGAPATASAIVVWSTFLLPKSIPNRL